MNRRDFLRSLAGLPLLGFLKPEGIGMGLDAPSYDEPLMTAPAPTITQQLESWREVYGLELGPEDSLYIK